MLPGKASKSLARSLFQRSQTLQMVNHQSLPVGIARRDFSDRLLGYSPMAQGVPQAPATSSLLGENQPRIPTAKDVTTTGGVWAPTSAKRDKLAELNAAREEGQETLDDAATSDQLQDLYLADGVQLIAKIADSVSDSATKEIQQFSDWLVEQQQKLPEEVDKDKLEAHLEIMSERVSSIMGEISAPLYLSQVRDFMDPSSVEEKEFKKIIDPNLSSQDGAFGMCVLLFRLQLTRSAIQFLKESWDAYTTVSDGDVDRAAVKGESLEPQATTVSLAKVYAYLFAHMSGTCSDRVDACWQLIDRDNDGRLEESEMNMVAQMCLAPVQGALENLFEQALEQEVTGPPSISNGEELPVSKSWRERRKETKAKKLLLKTFRNATQKHFEDEVELNHRLRCIYAWAEKKHQDNKLDSVMVDSGWSGKKRYVELNPKISLPEFREVQQEHFSHLDRIGTEILRSFREDLWVLQGKGRERQELMRDSFLFLTAVSIADYLILAS